jgi:hypothetical protein
MMRQQEYQYFEDGADGFGNILIDSRDLCTARSVFGCAWLKSFESDLIRAYTTEYISSLATKPVPNLVLRKSTWTLALEV